MTNFNENQNLNQSVSNHLKGLADFYKQPTIKLVQHLRDQDYSLEQIGQIMGISKQAVRTNYLPSGDNSNKNNTKSKTIRYGGTK